MSRTFNEIQEEILAAKATASELNALEVLTTSEQTLNSATSTSKVSIWRQWVWIFSFCIFSLEKLMDVFKSDVEKRIAETKAHTKDWYREKALAFLYGFQLGETDIYDTTGYTDAEINTAKIIANAAAVKTIISGAGALRLKLVRNVSNELAPLLPEQLIAITEYMNLVSDAGTTVIPTTGAADDLKLQLTVYYDSLILGVDGARLDGTDAQPIQTAIKEYLKSVKFNGSLIIDRLESVIGNVSGVTIPVVKNAYSKYAAYNYTDVAQGVGLINDIRVADAGYMKLDESELEITFIPYTE